MCIRDSLYTDSASSGNATFDWNPVFNNYSYKIKCVNYIARIQHLWGDIKTCNISKGVFAYGVWRMFCNFWVTWTSGRKPKHCYTNEIFFFTANCKIINKELLLDLLKGVVTFMEFHDAMRRLLNVIINCKHWTPNCSSWRRSKLHKQVTWQVSRVL